MTTKRRAIVALCALLSTAMAAPSAFAGPRDHSHGNNNGNGNCNGKGNEDCNGGGGGGGEDHQIQRVLLLSIDGFHAVDYLNCVKAGTCPNLAALGTTGVNYLATSTSKPSDSFPGLTAIISGGSPRTEGAFYDVAFDRSLQPPAAKTGNGLLPGMCTPNQIPTGTATEYEEGIDIDQSHLNGGAPSGDGGVNSIESDRLPRDPANNCNPVFPWNFVRTNTVFGVIHGHGGYTAWSDKHPTYASVSGPGATAGNINDFYGPEINSLSSNFESDNDIPVNFLSCNPLPDQNSVGNGDDYTGSFQNIQCYDAIKVQAILNEIDGKTHNASGPAPVPNLLGMNFQAVSVGEKLIEKSNGTKTFGGYLDAAATPSQPLLDEIEFVDASIGQMVNELNKQGLLSTTLIIVTAKHGQSPIDPARFQEIGNGITTDPATVIASLLPPAPAPENPNTPNAIGPTEDDVALLWLGPKQSVTTAVSMLEQSGTAGIGLGQIFYGAALANSFGTPGYGPPIDNGDPRTPDIIVEPNVGVVYTGSSKKQSEHGGFANDDTNVMMLLSYSGFPPATLNTFVETAQVAPTILAALGLDPTLLQGVQQEGTAVLPGLNLGQ